MMEPVMSMEEVGPGRGTTGWMGKLVFTVSVAMSLYAILWLSGAFRLFGIQITSMEHRGAILAFTMFLTFLLYPATKKAPRDRLPWYDIILMLMGTTGGAYFFFFYEDVGMGQARGLATLYQQALMLTTVIALLEGSRRILGPWLAGICGFFFFHVFFSNYFPWIFHAAGYPLARVTIAVFLSQDGIFGPALGAASTVVIPFIIFGGFLTVSGAGAFFINIAMSLFGPVRGGPAKISVVGSSLFGMLSGSTAANVATAGTFTIPMMKRVGFEPHVAGAVEAVCGNGGQFVPPVLGAVAFIMADWIGVSYWQICIASIVPAVLYYVALYVMVDLYAARHNIKGIPRRELPSLKETFKGGWQWVLPLAALLYFLGVAQVSVERSAMYTIVVLVAASLFRKETRMGPKRILEALSAGAKLFLLVGAACAAAGIVIGSIALTGLGVKLSNVLLDVGASNLMLVLVLTAGAAFILGMGISSVPIYIMLAILLAPALTKLGVPPLAGHMFLFWWGVVSFITPPVAVAAFVGAAIAKASPMRTAIEATRLGICTFIIPFMFVFSPALLMKGTPGEIILSTVTSAIGVAALATGLAGYLFKELNWFERILFMIAAVLLIVPGWQTDIAGGALLVLGLLWQTYVWRRDRVAQRLRQASGRS